MKKLYLVVVLLALPFFFQRSTEAQESKILFFSDRSGKQQIYIMNADGSNIVRLFTNRSIEVPGSCSPDGKKIAFISSRDARTTLEIYVGNIDGTEVSRLTNNQYMDTSPIWSPDGKKIIFESNRDGNYEIYVMNTDGSNQTRLTNHPAWDSYGTWSPDSKQIAFATKRHGERNTEIYVMNADGTGLKRLTKNTSFDDNPVWAPDGKSILFWSNRDGNDEIYVMNANGSNQKRLTQNRASDGSAHWSADGKKIAFESNRDGNYEIYVMNVNGTGAKNLTHDPSDDGHPIWVKSPRIATQLNLKKRATSDEIQQLYKEGVVFELKGQKAKAIVSYKSAIDLGASLVDVFLNLALIQKANGDFSGAISVLREGIRRNEAIRTSKAEVAKLYNNLGEVYRAQKKYKKAVENFKKALSLNKEIVGSNLNIGLCYDAQNLFEQAIPFYLREVEIAPDAKHTYEAYLNLGITFQEIKRDYDKSDAFLKNAIRVNPDRYEAYHSLANSYYLKGDKKSAIKYWKKVVEIAPNTKFGRIAKQNIEALE